jgi:hypothetical protein
VRVLTPLLAAAGLATAIAVAPSASALPSCTSVSGDELTGTSTTECETPGNVQINATPPVAEPDYAYPWDDEFYGSALIIGGGTHGGGHR